MISVILLSAFTVSFLWERGEIYHLPIRIYVPFFVCQFESPSGKVVFRWDIEIIELEVITTNENAIKLYEKFGFETIGIYENYFKIDDEYYDAQLMNLYLW